MNTLFRGRDIDIEIERDHDVRNQLLFIQGCVNYLLRQMHLNPIRHQRSLINHYVTNILLFTNQNILIV